MHFSNRAKAAAGMLAGTAAVLALSSRVRARRADGKSVFITGGSRGLGLALALEFAGRGANIAICGRNRHTLDEAVQRIRKCGVQALAIACDIRNPGEIAGAVLNAHRHFGRLDLLINNAGTIAVGPMESMTRADYEESLQTHFWAMYDAVTAAVPLFERRGGGRIVNITSIGGKVSVPHLLPYCVGKFAAVGYSEGLRASLRRKNITVTTVVPGLMRTGSPRNAWFKGQHRKEYAWFAISDALPIFSLAASSAARTIADAALRGAPEVVLSMQAKAMVVLGGLAPGLLLRVLELADMLLPRTGGIETQKARGFDSESAVTDSPLTVLSRKAERDYNQQ
jgi:NAD(P)-dependent dehydrogenase (short-subunit alcohol dehydrogenase family)